MYRTVKHNPLQRDDFLSDRAANRPKPPNTSDARFWEGFSTFDTVERARKKAVRFPIQGDFVAEIDITPESGIRYERTLTSSGHYTVWGDPDTVLEHATCVARVRIEE